MTREEADALRGAVDEILKAATDADKLNMRGVNWGDLRCVDVEERRSLLRDEEPVVYVLIEEADSRELELFVGASLEQRGYGGLIIETEW